MIAGDRPPEGQRRPRVLVVEAENGRVALEILARDPAIDAVLLDAVMPELDGLATLAAIRAGADTALLPVIFVTGRDEVSARVAALEAGATDYLVKPAHPDELAARVRAHLRGHAAWRSALEERIRTRAAVAEALCAVRPGDSAEVTGFELCSRISDLEEAAGAVIIRFDGSRATVLAGKGVAVRPGAILPHPLMTRLRAGAGEGAWRERREEQPAGSMGIPLMAMDTPAAAFAPLRSDGETFGVLGIAAAQAARRSLDQAVDVEARCLAAAIDFAPIAAAVLSDAVSWTNRSASRADTIREVIADGSIAPVFQPIIDLRTGDTTGYEALSRFPDGTPPQQWFADAHRVGLSTELEVATATAAVRASRRLPGSAWLALNVSPAFLTSGEPLASALGDARRPVVLEVTEHDPIQDYGAVLDALGSLTGGVQLSVDDAGAGYASLQHILALHPKYVKLDRGWISGIDDDPARRALVAGLGSFSRQTGCTLIAEGIERAVELEVLQDLDVHLGQGFLLGHPAGADTH